MKSLTVGQLIKKLEKYCSHCEVLVDSPNKNASLRCVNVRDGGTRIVLEISK